MITHSRGHLIGPVSILISNILMCMALLLLRHSSGTSYGRTETLLMSNFFASIVGYCFLIGDDSTSTFKRVLPIIIWSISYCFSYGLFLIFRGTFSLSQLIVCQSLAPFAAVYLSRDSTRAVSLRKRHLITFVPILLLMGIAFSEGDGFLATGTDSKFWLLFFTIFCSFVIAQTCARIVARTSPSKWSQPRLTILNALFLGLGLAFTRTAIDPQVISLAGIGMSCAIGLLVVGVQRLYVFGLSSTEPFMAAFILCTSIPLSIGFERLFEHKQSSPIELIFAFAYVVTMLIKIKVE